ncbi:putative MarR family transcriptional regulator [Listeria weihenstephanensis FSL R9-0317]|uniref:MarR family transcriptional regulator n=1 Tax=Listeria weihenstephanensis TaxID=1006155 RepID=A0A1S7FS83_9LIST|nr:MarR family transcriptional regulator [Listeria weihenstephanensis]AQY50284.1 MarR family transcriptional regulator [Listeria weihenstephanensis]EUJ40904.1 putative MarR family transcriptional regulator [Listeria weihenstephanensis FSL R9-0317]
MTTSQNDILTSFVSLTEKIANSKTNILDFGSPEMTFYRGEIHMIKMIGEFPGIYCSELARKLGITRAVVHRTVGILQKRGFIVRGSDEEDKKKFHLFLSDSGRQAYQLHEEYHQKHDQALLDYINELSPDQLESIGGFLKHATDLIDNHA